MAYGFFNLISGLAMLLASVLAGLLWDHLGASFTFYVGRLVRGFAHGSGMGQKIFPRFRFRFLKGPRRGDSL
jgi:hypothetical protein